MARSFMETPLPLDADEDVNSEKFPTSLKTVDNRVTKRAPSSGTLKSSLPTKFAESPKIGVDRR